MIALAAFGVATLAERASAWRIHSGATAVALLAILILAFVVGGWIAIRLLGEVLGVY